MKKPSKVEADKKLGGVIGQLVGDAHPTSSSRTLMRH